MSQIQSENSCLSPLHRHKPSLLLSSCSSTFGVYIEGENKEKLRDMFREKESEDLILRRQIKSEYDFFFLLEKVWRSSRMKVIP
jgi:hypothetical protein